MDLFIIAVLLVIVLIIFKRFNSFVYAVAIVDIFLRIVRFIAINSPFDEINAFLLKYFKSDLIEVFNIVEPDILKKLLMWGLVIIYILFEYYIIRILIKKRK